jgi:uncharacterized protein (DUF1330 family)
MMNRMSLRALALAGVLLAAGTGFVPARAQTAGAALAYYVAEFDLKNSEGIRPYSASVAGTFESFGGRYIVRGGRIAGLEGPAPGSRTVVIEFPSMERAQAWYDSDAYRAIRPIRQQSGVSRTYIIEGVPR